MKPYRVLTDEEWLTVAPLLPELQPRTETRGRPLTNTREVLNGVLWVMHSGSSWSMLPRRFPSYQTCHRRFKGWERTGVLKRVLTELFGEAGDEFHAAIVARMRNAQSDGASPGQGQAPITSNPAGGGALSGDRRWDMAPLQNAFGPSPLRARLVAVESAAAPRDNALTLADALSPDGPALCPNRIVDPGAVLASSLAVTRPADADSHERDVGRDARAD